MRHPWQQFVADFWVPTGCLGCKIHASAARAVRWWFLTPYGLFGLSNPCVTRDSSSLMISKSLRLFGLSNPWVTRDSSSLLFSKSLRLFGLSNPCVTRDSSSLMISQSVGAVWAGEFIRHPWQEFVGDIWVPRGYSACRIHASAAIVVRWWFLSR